MTTLRTWKESDNSAYTRIDTESEVVKDILVAVCGAKLIGEGWKQNSVYKFWILELPDVMLQDSINVLRKLKKEGVNLDA